MSKRPNIVIFNPDHYRGEALAHRGNPCVQTPNLDRIVENDGVSFSRAFCQNGVCTPSRCSFMSGWYPHVRGHRTMHHMLRREDPVLLRRLKQEGYFVWWGGKNDLVPAQHGFDECCDVKHRPPKPLAPGYRRDPSWRGEPGSDTFFSFYYGCIDKGDAEVYYDRDWAHVLGAVDQIANLPDDRPFCVYLPLSYPHPPWAVEEPFYSMIDRSKVPLRIVEPDDWSLKPSMVRGIHEKTGMQTWSEERWTELRATYYGMCSRLDHQFGLVLRALRDAGVYDDTAVFFFSDHGTWVGDYGVVDINQNTFEDSLVNVPLVIKPPAGADVKPRLTDAMAELIDVPATIEDLAGIEPDHTHFGRSLRKVLAGETDQHRDAVFAEGGRLHGERHCMELEYPPGHEDPNDFYYPRLSYQVSEGPEHTKAAMCRTETWKYVRRHYETDELYDLAKDPGERRNVINDPANAEILTALRDRMLTWYMETCDAVPFDSDKRFG